MECIDALLRAGADRSLRDMDGKTALDAAIEAGREDCARALNLEMGDATVSRVEMIYMFRHAMMQMRVCVGDATAHDIPREPASLVILHSYSLLTTEQVLQILHQTRASRRGELSLIFLRQS